MKDNGKHAKQGNAKHNMQGQRNKAQIIVKVGYKRQAVAEIRRGIHRRLV